MKINPAYVSAKAKDDTLELTIYGDIGENWWTGEGITPASVKKEIDGAGKFSKISVRINSPGGNVFDGIAIYNILRGQDKPVSVLVDGLAASAASLIAMAGDTRVMGTGSMMMVHDPWFMAVGNAAELREAADLLDKAADSMADIYAARTAKEKGGIRSLMETETWMSASEAVESGFATGVTEGEQTASASAKQFPILAKLKNLPDALKEQDEAPGAKEAAQNDGPPAEAVTVIRERFKIKHKRRA